MKSKYTHYYGQYRNTLSNLISISDENWDYYSSLIKVEHIQKGDLYIETGLNGNKYGFIAEGLLKQYFTTMEGKDHIVSFIGENMIAADFVALRKNLPARNSIEALEDTVILSLSIPRSEQEVQSIFSWEELVKTLIESRYLEKETRELELLSLNATERYDKFCIENSSIIGCLTQSDIASYLGINPASLSRIRGSKC